MSALTIARGAARQATINLQTKPNNEAAAVAELAKAIEALVGAVDTIYRQHLPKQVE